MTEHETIGNDDLIEFYKARLDEHETAARDCPEPGRSALLREVEEGRQLIREHEAADKALEQKVAEADDEGMPAVIETDDGIAIAPERFAQVTEAAIPDAITVLRLRQEIAKRAAIWHDHPGYRPDWDPDDGDAGT